MTEHMLPKRKQQGSTNAHSTTSLDYKWRDGEKKPEYHGTSYANPLLQNMIKTRTKNKNFKYEQVERIVNHFHHFHR